MLTILLYASSLGSQTLSLTDAYQMLEANYPTLRNAALNDQILRAELDILSLERKPTLNLVGSASLQSETIGFDGGENAPINIDIPLYNARAYGEVNYIISDGGRLDARKAIKAAEGKLGNQQLEVEKFSRRRRINQLFLGILLNRERVNLFETTLADIAERKSTVAAAVELGAALESQILQLSVREVEIEAQRDDVEGAIARLVANLATLTGQELSVDVDLDLPTLPGPKTITTIVRPELERFQLQRASIMANETMIEADTKPVISAFGQIGLGVPNPLNVFDSGISPYAIGGVNFRWKFKDWGKSEKQRELLQLRTAQLDNQQETFLFNLNAGNEAYLADIERLNRQIEQGRKIAGLQAEILTQLAAQLDNGVITATNYLTQANAELRARQALQIDETRLIELQLNFLNERGSL
jgi:outer membrane protein TolC